MGLFGSITRFVSNAASTCGHAVTAAVSIPAQGIQSAAELVAKVPIVGPAVGAGLSAAAGPLSLSQAILSGERIDKALVKTAEKQIAAAKTALPLAQTIVSIVPGVGSPALAGALGVAGALANGKDLSAAVVEGIKGSLPGGPLARAALDLALAAAKGENIAKAALAASVNTVPGLPPAAKNAMLAALPMIQGIASGKRLDSVALDAVRGQLPKNAQKAFDVARSAASGDPMAIAAALQAQLPAAAQKALTIGVAVGQGQKIQSIVTEHFVRGPLSDIAKGGETFVQSSPVWREGAGMLKGAEKQGFIIGASVTQKAGVLTKQLSALRNRLPASQRKGFDSALALHMGSVTAPRPGKMSARARAAFYQTYGIRSGSKGQKQVLVDRIKRDPEAVQGLKAAVKTEESSKGFWAWLTSLFS